MFCIIKKHGKTKEEGRHKRIRETHRKRESNGCVHCNNLAAKGGEGRRRAAKE